MSTLDEVRALEQQLIAAGHPQWAARIEDAVSGAATGGELWTNLGAALASLRRGEPTLPPEIRREVERLLQVVDKVLT